MKHKVVIAVANQVFEFDGEIIELTDDTIVLSASKGDIYIEKKYLVFIQFLNEQEQQSDSTVVSPPQKNKTTELLNKRLRFDPIAEQLDNIESNEELYHDEDDNQEIMRNVHSALDMALDKKLSLKQNIKNAMNGEMENFSINMGQMKAASPLEMALKIGKNVNRKKA